MNAQLLIGFGGTSVNMQWFGDMNSFNQQLNNSGLLNIPGYQVDILLLLE